MGNRHVPDLKTIEAEDIRDSYRKAHSEHM